MRLTDIEVKKIQPNKYNPNRIPKGLLTHLKNTIQRYGFLQPILVREVKENCYEIVDGEHRYKTLKELGYEKVPSLVIEVDDDFAKMGTLNMNNIRGKSDHIKVAKIIDKLREGHTEEQIAEMLGYSVADILEFQALTSFSLNNLDADGTNDDILDDLEELEKVEVNEYEDGELIEVSVTIAEKLLIEEALNTYKEGGKAEALVDICAKFLYT